MIYKIGIFFSNLILKNIFLFIALGIIRWAQIYIPELLIFGDYFEIYLLPLALAYTAGNIIKKQHGGNVALIAMSFLIFLRPSSSINQGIVIGVISGVLTKYLNFIVKKYIYSGLQMFFLNFVYPLAALITGLIASLILDYISEYSKIISSILIGVFNNIYGLIIITPVLEIGKVFFLNNTINHGVLSILGFSDLGMKGKSLLFLLETNPGPGLGVLLGLLLFKSKTSQKVTLFSNIFVEAIGGIHEVYFPYILKKLKLLWAVVLGGLAGNIIFYLFNCGLVGVSSPGSILNLMLLSKVDNRKYVALGVLLSTAISFLTTYFILKGEEKSLIKDSLKEILEENEAVELDKLKKIMFLCDAGMGSSTIGANVLRDILATTKYSNIEISNTFIGDKVNADLIISHSKLKKRIKEEYPHNKAVFVDDFFNKDLYIEQFLEKEVLEIYSDLSLKSTLKESALEYLGQQLEKLDFVEKGYMEKMIEREKKCCTYIGNGIAIPHGDYESRLLIKKNSVLIHHYPYGIDFENGERVYILIGIAIKDKSLHLDYISSIVKTIEDEELIENLILSDKKEEFEKAFSGGLYVK